MKLNLKPIVAVVLFGLSGAAFASTYQTHQMRNAGVQNRLNSMQSQLNQMEQLINQNGGGTQSMGGTSLQTKLAACPNWYDAINVSGLANVDGIYSNHSATFAFPTAQSPAASTFGGNGASSDLVLSNADLFVDAQVNNWTKVHIGLNYQSDGAGSLSSFTTANKSLIIKNPSVSVLDEAYVTIGNFCENPFYLRAGKQYVNFGNYDRFAAVPTFTQLLSQTDATAATVGFVDQGFYGSIFGFNGLNRVNNFVPATTARPNNGNNNINNVGANLGLAMQNNGAGFNVQAGYLNNMADVDYVSTSTVANANSVGSFGYLATSNGYVERVGAMSLDATGNLGIFDADAHYVSALGDFSTDDIIAAGSATTGARPSAMTLGAGVSFDMMGHTSRFGLDFQKSWQAENVGLYGMPEKRYEGTYNVDVSKNVNVGLDVFHDDAYDSVHGGSNTAATTGLIRLGVMFA